MASQQADIEAHDPLLQTQTDIAPQGDVTQARGRSRTVAAVACTVVGLVAIAGAYKAAIPAVDPALDIDLAEELSYLAQSWRTDPSQPFLVKPSKQIFDFRDDDIATKSFSKSKAQTISSSSVEEFASKMSVQMGLEGEYNFGASAFAAAADASLQAMTSAIAKQFRLDKIITVDYEHISSKPVRLFRHLRPDIKTLLLDQTCAKIVLTLGEFYATEAVLGGVFQNTVTMDMRSTDTELALQASIQASYSSLAGAASASLSGSSSQSAQVDNRAAKVKLSVLGGDTRLWLSLNGNNQDDLQRQWADSLSSENMFPLNLRLVPIWELLEDPEANPAKAAELKRYMLKKWEEEGAQVPHYDFADVGICPSCSSLVEQFSGSCEDIPAGFRLTSSMGLKYKDFGLDDDDHKNIASANECMLAAFGDGGKVEFSVESSRKSEKQASVPAEHLHWDGAWYSTANGYGKEHAQFQRGSVINWNFNKGDRGDFSDKDKAVTELVCHFQAC